jgi:D-Tyr-tRNAtyr deacylase
MQLLTEKKDIADIDTIQFSEHMVVVEADSTEHAIYLELSQKMVGVNFDMKYSKEVKSDEIESTKKAFNKYEDGRDLMLVRASSFKIDQSLTDRYQTSLSLTPRGMAEIIIQKRKDRLETLKQDLIVELNRAVWLEENKVGECRTFEDWQKRVRDNEQIEDSDASVLVQDYIEIARASYQKEGWRQLFKEKPQGTCASSVYAHIDESVRQLRSTTVKLNKFGGDLVNQTRSLRFFEAIQSIQACSSDDGLGCSSCTTQGLCPRDITVLFRCGHIVCNTCLRQVRQNGGNCIVLGCGAWNDGRQMIPGTNLVAPTNSNPVHINGKKLDEMVVTLKSLPESERVLVFAQHPTLIHKIKGALESADISFLSLEENSSKKLFDFQRSDCKTKVLILNIGDASAAGR